MEKENSKKTTGEGDAKAATGGASFCGCGASCCGGMDSEEMSTKWKDFCKGMPNPEQMRKMMEMFFQGGKKRE